MKLVRTSEETYKTKLRQVKALKYHLVYLWITILRNFNVNFNEARSTLEKLLTSEFEKRCIDYLTPVLSYNKITQGPQLNDVSLKEENFLVSLFGNFFICI